MQPELAVMVVRALLRSNIWPLSLTFVLWKHLLQAALWWCPPVPWQLRVFPVIAYKLSMNLLLCHEDSLGLSSVSKENVTLSNSEQSFRWDVGEVRCAQVQERSITRNTTCSLKRTTGDVKAVGAWCYSQDFRLPAYCRLYITAVQPLLCPVTPQLLTITSWRVFQQHSQHSQLLHTLDKWATIPVSRAKQGSRIPSWLTTSGMQLSHSTGLLWLRWPGSLPGHLVLHAREADAELVPADSFPQGPDGFSEPLLRLLPRTAHVARVCKARVSVHRAPPRSSSNYWENFWEQIWNPQGQTHRAALWSLKPSPPLTLSEAVKLIFKTGDTFYHYYFAYRQKWKKYRN